MNIRGRALFNAAGLLVLVLGAFSAHAQTACLSYPSNSAPPSGYGASWDVFSASKELLVKSTCPSSGSSITITVGKGDVSQYVWGEAYVYSGGWVKHILSGSKTNGWIAGSGSKTVTAPSAASASNPFYFVGYTCSNQGDSWKCGCADQSCAIPSWQLQAYTGSGGGSTTGGSGGGTGSGRVGKSGMPWNAGSWINGSDDRMQKYVTLMGHEPDAVTQGMADVTIWPNVGGADSEAEIDRDFSRSPAEWRTSAPLFRGVFQDTAWFGHIWGNYPATVHRRRIINLDWAEPIPTTVGNRWNGTTYSNPTLYKDIKEGAADKYIFLLGRKFAYLDMRDGDPDYPMTIDFFYEFTLESHGKSPEGSYMDGASKRFTYQDFPYAWARWIRVFKEGYKYQRGQYPNYLVAFRPQLSFINSDRRGGGSTIRHEQLWPNDVASWNPGERVINGITVLPSGPIGRQIDLVGASWHDSSFERVRGSSATAPGNNWNRILEGNAGFWGFNEIRDFAIAKGVKMVFPEWAPRREGNASTHPSDVIRFTYAFFDANKALLDHESYFDQGDGSIYLPWPANESGQNPIETYKELWRAR